MAQLRSKKIRTATTTVVAAAALVGGFTALPAQAAPAPAEGKVLAAGSPTAVKDSYIVTLKKTAGLKSASSAGKNLIKEYGGTVKKTFSTALNGYTATLSAAEARRLAADPAVATVEQNQTVHVDATQTSAPWGLDRIDQAALPLSGTYTYPDTAGAGVTAYVIDTGVRITHSQISGRATNGYDAVDGDTTAQDGNGHGTHVATTIAGSTYGVAKAAKIVAVRVLDNAGSGTTAGVIAGIDWVTANHSGPSVANMSLGGGAVHRAGHRGRQLHSQRRDLRGRGRQQQRQRLLLLPRPGRRGHHGRRHHQHGRPGQLLQLRLGPGHLRPGLLDHGGLEHQRHRDEHDLRYVDGHPARRGCGCRLPRGPHLGHPGPGRHGPHGRRHHRRGHQPGHRLPEPPAEDRPVTPVPHR